MAFVTICDKCQNILDSHTDSVEIRYKYDCDSTPLGRLKTVNLCAKCYKEIFGCQLEELRLRKNEDIDI